VSAVTDDVIDAIPGWFYEPDLALFKLLLDTTSVDGGDLAELGVFKGRSAVLLADRRQRGEELTLIDTFEDETADLDNRRENVEQYRDLTRQEFERYYQAALGRSVNEDPGVRVVQGLSSEVCDHARLGRHRFVHVDASHLYEQVAIDLRSARRLLMPDGVVVLDDYRNAHTPGTAAAVWQAVWETDLRPFALTDFKMYATWGNQGRLASAVAAWAPGSTFHHETQRIGDLDVHRVWAAEPGRHRFTPPVVLQIIDRVKRRRQRRTLESRSPSAP
jgi:SAM-dependent methyltransferase